MIALKKILPVAWILTAGLIALSCNNESSTKSSDKDSMNDKDSPAVSHDMHPMPDTATVPVVSNAEALITGTYPDTAVNGVAKFETMTDGKTKMILEITVEAKAGKSVAVHIHEHGDCGDNGKASHGHWNPGKAQHGKWGSASFHAGDIGNVKLDAKGKGSLTLITDLWTLGGKADKNIAGKAIIVHGGEDDYTTQPTGNAGSRIGCGLIQGK